MSTPALSAQTKAAASEIVAIRRDVHAHPEQGFKETRTSDLIERKLKGYGIEVKRVCETGIIGLIRGGRPGPTILIRADIDALPVIELNKVPYVSKTRGVMHACGHDDHIASALGGARTLAARRKSFAGNIKFMFQPAEEGPGGARPMIDAGLLENPKVDHAFALHMWNDLPVGQVGVRSGPVMASADEWVLTVKGIGGHGAAPHQTVDPVVVASHIVVALQTILSRNVDPVKCAVVTVGQITSGNRFNIIPAEAKLVGTVRALEEGVRLMVKRRIKEIAENIAKGLGATAVLDYDDGYPPTVNDAKACEMVRKAAAAVVGANNVVEQDITLGAEDMSYVLQKVPGCYWFLGSANRKKGLVHPHHSAMFDFDESALPIGSEIWLKLAEQLLK